MKIRVLSLALSLATASLMSMSASAVPISDNGNTKVVGPVVWHNQANLKAAQLLNTAIPSGRTSLYFVRRIDNDPVQTSANIAVNDRFQVSLHPGSFTQVYSCAGINEISAEVTGAKINNLSRDAKEFNLVADGHYFFYVDVEPTGETTLTQITEESAIPLLENKLYQNHQVSRVVDNCKQPVIAPIVVTAPPQVIVTPPPAPSVATPLPVVLTPPPVLEEKVSIKLEVLFDNDKSVIKPMYFSEINEVAEFMRRYSNTTAVIEGHTDSNGRQSYNQGLSERRAMSVKDMLVNRYGISPSRITSVGYGETRPVASNATAAGRQQNRRVIVVIEER